MYCLIKLTFFFFSIVFKKKKYLFIITLLHNKKKIYLFNLNMQGRRVGRHNPNQMDFRIDLDLDLTWKR